MVEWSISLLPLPVAHPGLLATWDMAGRHPQLWCLKAALTLGPRSTTSGLSPQPH